MGQQLLRSWFVFSGNYQRDVGVTPIVSPFLLQVESVEYVCEFKYSSGHYLYAPVLYNNHTHIYCQISMDQVSKCTILKSCYYSLAGVPFFLHSSCKSVKTCQDFISA